MDIVISHMSALHLMRGHRFPATGWDECPTELPSRMPSPAELREARGAVEGLRAFPSRIGVLVPRNPAGHASKGAVAHVWSAPLPAGALVELASGIRCVSPLLLPVLVAPHLSKLELQLLLAELLGLYAVTGEGETGLAQRDVPLITREELLAFLDALGSARGARMVRQALGEAPVLAASPQEAKLFLRATLSHARGGYRLGKVVLNDPVELERISSGIKTLQVRKPDLLLLGKDGGGGVCLDYMGAWHASERNVRRDANRRNELIAAGFKPYEIFKEHYDDLDYLDGLIEAIRADLGISRREVTLERQRKLRRARFALWRDLEAIDLRAWEWREELR